MKNKVFIVIFLMAIIGLISCESDEEFLTENPKTFYTLDNAFTSTSQVDQVLISCYQHVRSLKLPANNISRINAGWGSDVLSIAFRSKESSFDNYARLSPLSNEYNDMYSTYYQLISKANTALYAANLENIDWSDEGDKRYAIAQAKFFRAFGYINLGELFGGVPIVDEVITTPKYDFTRSSRVETYQFAIDDLESILDDLPETTQQGGRIVKGAAQHYLSELYLAQGIELEDQGDNGDANFQKAVQYANSVIDGGIYELMTERFGTRKDEGNTVIPGAPGDVFWDLFQVGNVNYQEGNKECIWAYQVDFGAHEAEDGQSAMWYGRIFMPALRVLDGFQGVSSDVGGRGIIYTSPTLYTIEEIWEGDFWNDIRNAEHNIQRYYKYNDPTFEKFGETVYWWDVAEKISGIDDGVAFPIWWKLSTDQYYQVGSGFPDSRLFRDEYAIRLPETILLRAEAYWRLDQNQKAADDINIIRERAQCEHLITAGEVNLNMILDERARELFGEENRWQTLLRMGGTVAVDRLHAHNYWPNKNIENTLNFSFNLWPIPQEVIDRNIEAKLEQNPGWE